MSSKSSVHRLDQHSGSKGQHLITDSPKPQKHLQVLSVLVNSKEISNPQVCIYLCIHCPFTILYCLVTMTIVVVTHKICEASGDERWHKFYITIYMRLMKVMISLNSTTATKIVKIRWYWCERFWAMALMIIMVFTMISCWSCYVIVNFCSISVIMTLERGSSSILFWCEAIQFNSLFYYKM